jgi:hypothetical protein
MFCSLFGTAVGTFVIVCDNIWRFKTAIISHTITDLVMDLTAAERMVIERLQQHRVATMKTLCGELDVSHMTVVRACKKYGYLSSINRKATFYTLHDVPRFDRDGLWLHHDICFSQHGTLLETLVRLIQNAPAGFTVAELEQRLRTRVGNLLSRLCGQQAVTRCFTGRQAVYLAIDGPRQQQQRDARERHRSESPVPAPINPAAESAFPPRCDVILVLEVLIQIIKRPQADAHAVARELRTNGRKITGVQVQRVFDFYSIKKKRHTGDR